MPEAILALVFIAGLSLRPAQDPQAPPDPKPDPAPPQTLLPNELDEWTKLLQMTVQSATATDLPIARSPSAISVLTGDQIRRSGVRFLTDSFRLVPGFEVSRLSATESNVSARSFNADTSSSQGILGLVDGRVMTNEFFGNVFWEALPLSLDDIQRVEIVRGPESFVYGPNAMYGLVNIVTKAPLDYGRDEVFLSGAAGSYDSTVGSAVYVRRLEDTGFKATVGWDSIEDFQESNGTQKNKVFAELRVEHRFDGFTMELTAGIDRQKLDTLIPTFEGISTTEFASELQDGYVKLDYRMGLLKAFVSYDNWRSTSVPEALYSQFSLSLDTLDAEAIYTLDAWTGHTLTAGTGFRYAEFRTSDLDVSEGRHSTELGWIFVQDELVVTKELWVTAGVRLDEHSRTGTNLSPRFAVVWEFLEKQNLRASAGEGFRNPSLREFWFNLPVNLSQNNPPIPGATAVVTGNPDLKAEKNRSLELAYIGTPTERLRFECTGYYSLIDHLVHLGPSQGPLPPGIAAEFTPSNSGADKVYGVETQIQYLIADNLSAFGNYSYGIREDRHTGDINPNAPRNKGNAGARFTFPDPGLSGMLWTTYFGPVDFPPLHNPGYTLVNARIAYDFNLRPARGQLFLEAFNMLDKVHRENPSGDEYGALVMAGLNVSF